MREKGRNCKEEEGVGEEEGLRNLPKNVNCWCGWAGLEIASNGIQLLVDNRGRSSGEAYVQFTSKEQSQKALALDRGLIGHRQANFIRFSIISQNPNFLQCFTFF